MKKPLNWIPLWIDPWLFGSTRIELSLEQRAVWVDLLTLAGKDSGFIRANEGVPYPPEQLAGLLRVPQDILLETIRRCIETGKLERPPDGTLRIVSWETYKLTPRYRRMLEPPSQTLPPKKEEKREKERRVKASPKSEHTSQKEEMTRENASHTEENGLPEIPRQAPFEVKDRLKSLRHRINERSRKIDDVQYQHRMQISVEDLKKEIADYIEEYKNFARDYADE